mgnify:CR=1 FL=1
MGKCLREALEPRGPYVSIVSEPGQSDAEFISINFVTEKKISSFQRVFSDILCSETFFSLVYNRIVYEHAGR